MNRRSPLGPMRALIAAALLCVALPGFGQALALKPAESQAPWSAGIKAIAIGAVALGLTFAGLRRWRGGRTGRVDVVGPVLASSRRVSQKTVLLVVHWQGKAYLLSETGQSLQLLDSAAIEEAKP